jgi:C-terminal processing protease CtpA/Prc
VVPAFDLPEAVELPPLSVELSPVESGQEPRLELAGLGCVLQAEGDALMVQRLAPFGGAAEAGLAPGDAILAIDGKPAAQLGFEGAIDAIRGPEGTDVTLKIRRADGQVVEIVARRKIVRN